MYVRFWSISTDNNHVPSDNFKILHTCKKRKKLLTLPQNLEIKKAKFSNKNKNIVHDQTDFSYLRKCSKLRKTSHTTNINS